MLVTVTQQCIAELVVSFLGGITYSIAYDKVLSSFCVLCW